MEQEVGGFATPSTFSFHVSVGLWSAFFAGLVHTRTKMRIKPETGFERAVQILVVRELRRIRKCQPAVLAGDVEAIHDFRASLRRIRVLLDVAGGKRARRLRKRAGRFSRDLGKVRDLDVAIELLVQTPALSALRTMLAESREDELKSFRSALTSRRFQRWQERMVAWTRKRRTGSPVADKLPRVLLQARREAIQHLESDSEMHLLRIGIKNCRYLVELFEGALPNSAEEVASELRAAQDAFGNERDRQRVANLANEHGIEFSAVQTEPDELRRIAEKALSSLGSLVS